MEWRQWTTCEQVSVRVLDENGLVIAPKHEANSTPAAREVRGCGGRLSEQELLEHQQQDALELKTRLKDCHEHDDAGTRYGADEHVYLFESFYEYSLYDAEHDRLKENTDTKAKEKAWVSTNASQTLSQLAPSLFRSKARSARATYAARSAASSATAACRSRRTRSTRGHIGGSCASGRASSGPTSCRRCRTSTSTSRA